MFNSTSTVRGKFIGITSCGFVTGNVYNLRIYCAGNLVWVSDIYGMAKCPYASIKLLAQNWEIPTSSFGMMPLTGGG